MGCTPSPPTLWQATLTGAAVAPPAAASAWTALVATSDQFAAFGVADGKEQWRVGLPGGCLYTPLVVDTRIYLPRADGALVAYDMRGTAQWTTPTAGSPLASPAVGYGLLFVLTTRGVQALDPATGKIRWTHALASPLPRSLIVDHRHTLFVATRTGTIKGLEPRTGRVIWQYEVGTAIAAPPRVDDFAVFVADSSGRLLAVPRLGPRTPRWTFHGPGPATLPPVAAFDMLYFASGKRLYALNASFRRWSYLAEAPLDAGPLVVGERVVVANFLGHVAALDPRTGELRWKRQVGRAAAIGLTAAGSTVFAHLEGEQEGGTLFAIEADTGRVAWRATHARGFRATPLVLAGRVIAPTVGGEILAFPAPGGGT
jgi:outer membrane protein assembly factor BamB